MNNFKDYTFVLIVYFHRMPLGNNYFDKHNDVKFECVYKTYNDVKFDCVCKTYVKGE